MSFEVAHNAIATCNHVAQGMSEICKKINGQGILKMKFTYLENLYVYGTCNFFVKPWARDSYYTNGLNTFLLYKESNILYVV